MYCTNCGAKLAPGAKFCTNCGTPVDQPVGQAQPAEQTPPTYTQPMPVPMTAAQPMASPVSQAQESSRLPISRSGIRVIAVVALAALVAVLALGVGLDAIPSPLESVPDSQTPAASTSTVSTQATPDAQPSDSTPSTSTQDTSATSTDATTSATQGTSATSDATTSATQGTSATSDATGSVSNEPGSMATTMNAGSVDFSNGTLSSDVYGYTLSIPSTFNQGVGGDADTVGFEESQSDVTVSVSAYANTYADTLDDSYETAKKYLGSNPYTTEGDNWYVVSDQKNGYIYYTMTYVVSDRIVSMTIMYPESEKDYGSSIVEQVQPTFKLTY